MKKPKKIEEKIVKKVADLTVELLETIRRHIPTAKTMMSNDIERDLFVPIVQATLRTSKLIGTAIKSKNPDFDVKKYQLDIIEQIYNVSKNAIEDAFESKDSAPK